MVRHNYCDGACLHFISDCSLGHELNFTVPGSWDHVQQNDWGFWRSGKCVDRKLFPEVADLEAGAPVTFSREEIKNLTAKALGGNDGTKTTKKRNHGEDMDQKRG